MSKLVTKDESPVWVKILIYLGFVLLFTLISGIDAVLVWWMYGAVILMFTSSKKST